jgi:methylglyoxal synthase
LTWQSGNIPIACNRTSADYLITSPLLGQDRGTTRPFTGPRA